MYATHLPQMSESRELTGEVNPDDLEPTIDIDLKTQKRILVLFGKLEKLDHYQLLGLPLEAEKKEIKHAYFDCMNEFHLDKFYGKNIGAFGPRLQKIVQFLTRASDTLSRKKTRAEYDRYLASRKQTLGARESIPPAPRSAPPQGQATTRTSRPAVAPIDVVNIPRAPRAPDIAASEHGASTAPTEIAQAKSLQDPTPTPAQAPVDGPKRGNTRADAARRLLARKMGGRPPAKRPGSPRPSAPPPGASPAAVREALDADLKARFDARRNQGRDIVTKYTAIADEARKLGDWGAAVGAIRTAAQAMPDDPDLIKRVQQIQSQADEALAPRFLEQGKYEEREGSYERAARSYERAARGKNSAELYCRAAKCLLRASRLDDENKRKLVEMARKSVSLDNREVDYRLTLAKAYDVTGMRTSAQGEVRRALELDPANKDAKELQKALK
jgi:tetratricopeptide (TPR) repeat protein